MSNFFQFVSQTLIDGQVDESELGLLEERLLADGKLDLDDVKLLVELYCNARQRSPAFEKLFFTVLESVFLSDGQVQLSEQFYLLKMLYSDRDVSSAERDFLGRLQSKATQRTPEFDALCESARTAV